MLHKQYTYAYIYSVRSDVLSKFIKILLQYSKVQVIKDIVTLHLNSSLAMGFASMPLFDLAKFLHLREFCNAQRI